MQLKIVPTIIPGTFVVMDKGYLGEYEVFRGTYQACYEYINPITTSDWIAHIKQLNDKI